MGLAFVPNRLLRHVAFGIIPRNDALSQFTSLGLLRVSRTRSFLFKLNLAGDSELLISTTNHSESPGNCNHHGDRRMRETLSRRSIFYVYFATATFDKISSSNFVAFSMLLMLSTNKISFLDCSFRRHCLELFCTYNNIVPKTSDL